MKVGDLVKIKSFNTGCWITNEKRSMLGKLGIVVVCGTWSVDVRIFENGLCPRVGKEDCEVINESR